MIYESDIIIKTYTPDHTPDKTDDSNHPPLVQSNRFVSCLIPKTYKGYILWINRLPETLRNERNHIVWGKSKNSAVFCIQKSLCVLFAVPPISTD